VEWHWQGKPEVSGEKPVAVPVCPPKFLHGITRDRAQVLAVRGPANNSLSLSLSLGKAFFFFISLCSCYPLLLSSDLCFLYLSCMCLAYVLFNFISSSLRTATSMYASYSPWCGLDGQDSMVAKGQQIVFPTTPTSAVGPT